MPQPTTAFWQRGDREKGEEGEWGWEEGKKKERKKEN